MKLSEKQKIIVTAGCFALVAAGIGGLVYVKLKERGEFLGNLDRLAQEERLATEKIQRIPGLREERSKLINIIDQYAEILPRDEHVEQDTFVEIIDGYRRDTKVIIQKAEYIKPKAVTRSTKDKAPASENFIQHRYKFKLLGTVPDFIEFVNKIENHTRFLKVDAINIRPVGSQPTENMDDLSEKVDDEELLKASEPVKEIELTVSTYTYSKGPQNKS